MDRSISDKQFTKIKLIKKKKDYSREQLSVSSGHKRLKRKPPVTGASMMIQISSSALKELKTPMFSDMKILACAQRV